MHKNSVTTTENKKFYCIQPMYMSEHKIFGEQIHSWHYNISHDIGILGVLLIHKLKEDVWLVTVNQLAKQF